MLLLLLFQLLFSSLAPTEGAPLINLDARDVTFTPIAVPPPPTTPVQLIFDYRSVWNITWSCISVVFACTWTAVHPNVYGYGSTQWQRTKRRTLLFLLALFFPGAALVGLAIVFGAYALLDGMTAILTSVQVRHTDRRWGWLLFQGIVSLVAGLAALIFPGLAGTIGGLVILWTIVIYSAMHGIGGIISAAGAGHGSAKTWGVISGVVTVLFGVLLAILVIVTPQATLAGLVFVVGFYAIIFGVMLIVLAVQLRRGIGSILKES